MDGQTFWMALPAELAAGCAFTPQTLAHRRVGQTTESDVMPWFLLAIAITGEVIATTALKASDGFTKWNYGIISIVGYAVAFYFLSIVLKTMPVGVAYAIWAGAGVAMVTFIGIFLFDQKLDLYSYLGIGLIVAGVAVLNLLSETTAH